MKRLGRVGLVISVLTLTGTTACEDKPDPAKLHRIQGSDFLNKKDWKNAAAEYTLSLQADPNQGEVWKKKAYAHMQMGESEETAKALVKYSEFVKDAQEKADLQLNIAQEYLKARKVEEANAAFAKILATKTEPKDQTAFYRSVADAYLKAGLLDEGERQFNEALKIDPKDEASLGWLAEIYATRGGARSKDAPVVPEHLDKSLEYYDQVIAINPAYPFSYVNKRIVMAKYLEYEVKQKEIAELEAKANAKNKAKAKEAQARAADHLKRAEDYKRQFDELTVKYTETLKPWKEQQEKLKQEKQQQAAEAVK
jgi:tetratricopeptide (TPR) repeat protein